MRKQRLLRLADVLDNFKEEAPEGTEFNLAYWSCGTAACAFGTACKLPEFQKKGLSLVGSGVMYRERDGEWLTPQYTDPKTGEKSTNFFAAEEFFSLKNWYQSLWLFNSTAYPNGDRTRPATVAKRIREFVHTNGKSVPKNFMDRDR